MKNKNNFNLTKAQKDEMISAIKSYYLDVKDEEIGDLAANMLLNFIIDKLAPEFYNLGVFDAYKYMNERIEDLLTIQK